MLYRTPEEEKDIIEKTPIKDILITKEKTTSL